MTDPAASPAPSPSNEGDGTVSVPGPAVVPDAGVESLVRELASRRARREEKAKASRAGRDLPMAIGVGTVLLAVLLVGMFLLPPLFVVIGAVVCSVGVWEVSRALQNRTGVPVPLVPLVVAGVAMPTAASLAGAPGLAVATIASALLVTLWNAFEGRATGAMSIGYSLVTMAWVPLLASFAFLLYNEPNGPFLLISVLLLVISNDTFGYIFGAWLGKHPLAPKISPKKSWEGFAGSVGGAVLVGVLLCLFLLHLPWWVGALMAVATVVASTCGDLAESMVKRELGIKDMSNVLPGHGGIMDRLDSILFAVPIGYLVVVLAVGYVV